MKFLPTVIQYSYQLLYGKCALKPLNDLEPHMLMHVKKSYTFVYIFRQ